jgi:hypothetical protein
MLVLSSESTNPHINKSIECRAYGANPVLKEIAFFVLRNPKSTNQQISKSSNLAPRPHYYYRLCLSKKTETKQAKTNVEISCSDSVVSN